MFQNIDFFFDTVYSLYFTLKYGMIWMFTPTPSFWLTKSKIAVSCLFGLWFVDRYNSIYTLQCLNLGFLKPHFIWIYPDLQCHIWVFVFLNLKRICLHVGWTYSQLMCGVWPFKSTYFHLVSKFQFAICSVLFLIYKTWSHRFKLQFLMLCVLCKKNKTNSPRPRSLSCLEYAYFILWC